MSDLGPPDHPGPDDLPDPHVDVEGSGGEDLLAGEPADLAPDPGEPVIDAGGLDPIVGPGGELSDGGIEQLDGDSDIDLDLDEALGPDVEVDAVPAAGAVDADRTEDGAHLEEIELPVVGDPGDGAPDGSAALPPPAAADHPEPGVTEVEPGAAPPHVEDVHLAVPDGTDVALPSPEAGESVGVGRPAGPSGSVAGVGDEHAQDRSDVPASGAPVVGQGIVLPLPGDESVPDQGDPATTGSPLADGEDRALAGQAAPLPDLAHGLLDDGLLGHIAHGLGLTVAADELAEVWRSAVADDPDLALGLDARSGVRLLEGLGIDAAVAHGTVETLADFLREGRAIILGMADDDGYVGVMAIDEERAVVELADGRHAWEVPLERFAEEWAVAANELVVAEGLVDDRGLGALSLDAPGIVVLPMASPGGT